MEISLWSDLAGLHANEPGSRRRRRWFERTVGCHVDHIARFEALGVVATATIDLTADAAGVASMAVANAEAEASR